MSAADSPENLELPLTDSEQSEKPDLWARIDQLLENGSEYLNPILVKETRQALKSRQFVITFTLVLIAAWGWSMLGIATYSPGIAYSPNGPNLLFIYLDILLFPLVIIIPFSAFRSLASEREDGTYELLSISTLKPEQIIWGKLGSSILQTIVYFSALAPCIAFTYLLRGIDVITIAFMLVIVFLLNILLSVAGLLLATVTKSRQWQTVLSVVVVLLFAFCYIFTLFMSYIFTLEETSWREYDEFYFWVGMFGAFTGIVSIFSLLFFAASAQITFASENRSSKLRVIMLLQHFLLLGWSIYSYIYVEYEFEALIVSFAVLAIHWTIMGALMNGEQSALSPRVRRSIPETFVGRITLNWFLPGPSRGYFLAISSLISGAISIVLIGFYSKALNLSNDFGLDMIIWYASTVTCYAIIYLSLGRVIMLLFEKFFYTDVFLSLLVHILLVLMGTFAPIVVHFSINSISNYDYSVIEMSNPFWTIAEFFDGLDLNYNDQFIFVQFCLITATFFSLLVMIIVSAKDLVPAKSSTPERVLEEDALLAPEQEPESESPWD